MSGTARPTTRQLLVEVRDVVTDLPTLLTAPLYRSWHLRWGATPAEVAARLQGEGLVEDAQYQSTRAISIAAPPEAVWPWLVQVGCLRAGWYSNDLLDNLAHPSATDHHPRPPTHRGRPVGADVPETVGPHELEGPQLR